MRRVAHDLDHHVRPCGRRHWARHLLRLRELQERPAVSPNSCPALRAEEAPIYLKGRARARPDLPRAVLMHAVARLALHPLITNIQTSWVKMGPTGSACV